MTSAVLSFGWLVVTVVLILSSVGLPLSVECGPLSHLKSASKSNGENGADATAEMPRGGECADVTRIHCDEWSSSIEVDILTAANAIPGGHGLHIPKEYAPLYRWHSLSDNLAQLDRDLLGPEAEARAKALAAQQEAEFADAQAAAATAASNKECPGVGDSGTADASSVCDVPSSASSSPPSLSSLPLGIRDVGPSRAGFIDDIPSLDFLSPADMELAARLVRWSLPFVLRRVPDVLRAANRWTPEYLSSPRGFGKRSARIDIVREGTTFHWHHSAGLRDWPEFEPQHTMEYMSYAAWRRKMTQAQIRPDGEPAPRTFYYLQTNHGTHPFLLDDLPMFRPPSFFAIPTSFDHNRREPLEIVGQLQCRWAPAGLRSVTHYDTGDNFIAMIRGEKRYIILPPDECSKLNLTTTGPEMRHSQLDWMDPAVQSSYNFTHTRALSVSLRTGSVLFMPSYWFHYIASVNDNIQCNQRNSRNGEMGRDIELCGFPQAKNRKRKTWEGEEARADADAYLDPTLMIHESNKKPTPPK